VADAGRGERRRHVAGDSLPEAEEDPRRQTGLGFGEDATEGRRRSVPGIGDPGRGTATGGKEVQAANPEPPQQPGPASLGAVGGGGEGPQLAGDADQLAGPDFRVPREPGGHGDLSIGELKEQLGSLAPLVSADAKDGGIPRSVPRLTHGAGEVAARERCDGDAQKGHGNPGSDEGEEGELLARLVRAGADEGDGGHREGEGGARQPPDGDFLAARRAGRFRQRGTDGGETANGDPDGQGDDGRHEGWVRG
jgi:hypothetical protein